MHGGRMLAEGGGGGHGIATTASGAGSVPRELDQTPTWAAVAVCAVIVLISKVLEKVLHGFGEWFTKRRKKAMFEALENVKTELMVLGFISLLLTFGQNYIIRICIPEKAANTMLPCPSPTQEIARLLLSVVTGSNSARFLSEASPMPACSKGQVPLITINALHQLHIFIFFLALFHVFFSAITMVLGRAKIRCWKEWEIETTSTDYEFSNDPARFRFTHETSFVKQHTSFWNKLPVSFYAVSFFRQFFRSVRKIDYLALRHGFISVHLSPGSKFDFQKYIKRSLEDDFKVVVGISPILWASAFIFQLLSVNGWHTLLWISIMPLIIILLVGTKLQAIISMMAIEIQDRHAVVQGIPLVQVSDHHFWFGQPHFLLFLIHFTLFQNAFQIIYFLWIWYEFGVDSCFNPNPNHNVARVCLGAAVQFLCSYITLPLYALVSQMGSQMKRSIFDEETSKALKKWHMAAKKKNVKGSGNSPTARPAESSPDSNTANTGMKQLHRLKSSGHAAITKALSNWRSSSDPSEMEMQPSSSMSTAPPSDHQLDLLTGSPK